MLYEALDSNGLPYLRLPKRVGEVDYKIVKNILAIIAKSMGVNEIKYGVPLHITLGLSKQEAYTKKDKRYFLKGEEFLLPHLQKGE